MDKQEAYSRMFAGLREAVLEHMEWSETPEDADIHERIEAVLLSDGQARSLPAKDRARLHRELFDSLRRYDTLTAFLNDSEITEVMVNGWNHIFLERAGKLVSEAKGFSSEEILSDLIQRITASVNRSVTTAYPIADARMEDGSRVCIVLPPVSLDGPSMTIRKFSEKKLTMERMVQTGTFSREAAEFLDRLVRARYNILISGGTGSGKTTLLNALSGCIPGDQRVITIEDSAELQLHHIENLVRLETRNASVDGQGEVSMRDLIKTSLRLRPDRIIVGEVRGAEVVDMLQAMNTGHDGSLSTGHANSARAMLTRLEVMFLFGMDIPLLAVREQIASAIDIIVQIARLRDGSRKVLSISEIDLEDGKWKLNDLFVFRELGEEDGRIKGELIRTRNSQHHTEKLRFAGFLPWTDIGDGD